MANKRRLIAEVFPPGDLIRQELEARGWTQSDLAAIFGRPFQTVNSIINRRKAITPRTARNLEAAFGPSAEFWMNLEMSYRFHKEGKRDLEIIARARKRETSESIDTSRIAGKR